MAHSPGDQQTELLKTALNKMRQGLCFFDAEQRLVLSNNRFATIYGLSPDQIRPGMRLAEVVALRYASGASPDIEQNSYLRWREGLARTKDPTHTVVRLKDGRTVAINHEPTPGGGWVATHDDISDLVRADERLRLAAEATGLGIWDVDLQTGESWWSREMYGILGLPETVCASSAALDACIHPDDLERARQVYEAASLPGGDGAYLNEFRIIRADNGECRWLTERGKAFFASSGNPVRMVGTVLDVTRQREGAEELRRTEERLQLALQVGRMVAWERDLITGSVKRSENAEDVYGLASGDRWEFDNRVHPEDRHKIEAMDFSHSDETLEFRYLHPAGKPMWLGMRAAPPTGNRQIGVTFDITKRKVIEEEVRHIANHDWLTGLPNRGSFQRTFDAAFADEKLEALCLLLLDLDDFKDVNDTLGHDAGDALLKETASRLGQLVADQGTLARLGGDELAILIIGADALRRAMLLAEQLIAEMKRPFTYNGQNVLMRASIGMAAFPEHQSTASDLMKAADIALYQAKADGRSRAVTYSSELKKATDQRVAVLNEIQGALASNRIVPFYQPKICLKTGQVSGFEALARWQHPAKGVLTPDYFGAVFDHSELSERIGAAMLEQVCRDIRTWLDLGLDCGRTAVNISAAEFRQRALAESVLRCLHRHRIPTRCFEVEVTESVFLAASTDYVLETLSELKQAGVLIALDDFGTGFASLTHLKKFPVGHIKIDKSFVHGLGHNHEDSAIVGAVTSLARNLNMIVTAEGVETATQANMLRDMTCDFAQGYLYAKPMIASRVPDFLRTWKNTRYDPLQRSA